MTREIKLFVGMNFLISWMFWGMLVILTQLKVLQLNSPIGIILLVIGGNAPPIYELCRRKKLHSKKEYKDFLKNIVNPKNSFKWYIIMILLVIINAVVPGLIESKEEGVRFINPIYMVITTLPIMIIGGGLEEIGWRGFLQPNLEKLLPPFISTVIVGVIWAIWHLPLWFVVGSNQGNMDFLVFTINAIGLAFILNIIYSGTKSIFLCIICHALVNSFMAVVPLGESMLPNIVILLCNITFFITYKRYSNKYNSEKRLK